MVRLIEIQKQELSKYVFLSYEGDDELLSKYHIHEFTLEEAVNSTLEMVEVTKSKLRLVYYKVMYNETPIGYVIISGNHLYSFAISIKYRTKEILKEWWKEVERLLGERYTCLLFENNKRAIDYLKKRGMKIEWQNTEHEKLNEVLLTY